MNKVLFPCEPFNQKQVDWNFREEYKIANLLGIKSFLYDHDIFVDEGKLKFFDLKEESCSIILRGWMLTPNQYDKLYNFLLKRNCCLCNGPLEYIQCHYLKNSYDYIKDLTFKTLFSDKFDKEILGEMMKEFPGDVILKDYVKSEKGIPELFRIPKETSPEKMEDIVKRFIEARGKLFTGGISLREFTPLKKYDGEVNEWRAFIFNNKVVSLEQNSNIKSSLMDKPLIKFVENVCSRFAGISSFFTVDFAEKENGEWIVVETGDGQVSGLAPKQNPIGLYNAFL